jgi:hypothetical protein
MGDINNNGDTEFQGCFCTLAENFSAIFEYSYRSMFLQSFVKIGHSSPRNVPCEFHILLCRNQKKKISQFDD